MYSLSDCVELVQYIRSQTQTHLLTYSPSVSVTHLSHHVVLCYRQYLCYCQYQHRYTIKIWTAV